MLSVLIDVAHQELNDCFGISSCLQLPLFKENLFKEILNNVISLNARELYVLTNNSDLIENNHGSDFEIISNIEDIECVFFNNADEYVVFLKSDIYFEVDNGFGFISDFENNTEIVSENGDLIGVAVRCRDVFKLISNQEFKLEKIKSNIKEKIVIKCYSRVINTPLEYKGLINDILKGETKYRLPEVAQGVFAESKIPQGDFVIIPPVYFDDCVQVENGCIVGPCTAIMKNSLIATNSNIRNTFVGQGNYISSGCFLDGVMCCENVNIRRNSVVFSDTVLGRECSLGEESVIENSSYIRAFSRVDDFKKNYVNFKPENNQSPAGFYGYTPEKSALLGAVLGIAFNSPKIAVATDGQLNSTALKLALLGGLITTGAACFDFGNTFLAALHYYMNFCELDCAVFISGNKDGTAITVFSKNTYSLSNSDYYNIKNIMTFSEIKRCDSKDCKTVRQIHGMQRMYVQNLIKRFENKLKFVPVFKCDNKKILNIAELAVSKIGLIESDKKVFFTINRDGTKLTAEYKGTYFSYGKLLEIVSYFVAENGDVFYKDFYKNNKALWTLDAVFLCFKLIEILNKNDLNIIDAYKLLPTFYLAENTIETELPLSTLASEISSNNFLDYSKGELSYNNDRAKIRINKNADGSLKIAAKAVTIEAAREIVGELSEMIRKYHV